MQTDSSGEFWQGRAPLAVADEAGRDIGLPGDVRFYLFDGTQHGGRTATGVVPFCRHPGNPVEMSPRIGGYCRQATAI